MRAISLIAVVLVKIVGASNEPDHPPLEGRVKKNLAGQHA
jgi:hypothetical protein